MMKHKWVRIAIYVLCIIISLGIDYLIYILFKNDDYIAMIPIVVMIGGLVLFNDDKKTR